MIGADQVKAPLVIERAYQQGNPAYGWTYRIAAGDVAPYGDAPLSDHDIATLSSRATVVCAFCAIHNRTHAPIWDVADLEQCSAMESNTFFSDGWMSQ